MKTIRRRICAVVPAAGRGTRLGTDTPKVFVPLHAGVTPWDRLRERLAPLVDEIVLILSPAGREFVAANGGTLPPERFEKTTFAIQPEPRGMGDAIFGAAASWRGYDDLLVVWGDQFNLSAQTLQASRALHIKHPGKALTLPLVRMPQPYVEYVFDAADRLVSVWQSREGESCAPNGLSDVGTFLLSVDGLETEWERFRAAEGAGSVTGETNFLPFLAHLSRAANWSVQRYETGDPAEAVGINTPEDLAFARRTLEKGTA